MQWKDVSQKEVLRYLGYGRQEADEAVKNLVSECIGEILNHCHCKHVYKRFHCTIEQHSIMFDNVVIESKNLSKNLSECEQMILFAATLCPQPDILLKKYSRLDMSKAVVMQAAAAAIIEEYCDQCQKQIEKELEQEQLYLRPRFSPGYGDFQLKHQKDMILLLDCPRKIGLTLTDSLLLAPSKSVTAVMGISKKNKHCHIKGCEACENRNCTFRRDG